MRRRILAHAKALLFSMSAAGLALLITFFCYDAPMNTNRIEAVAQAIEPVNVSDASSAQLSESTNASPLEGLLPASFKSQWRQIALDHNQIHLKILNKPLLLSHTTHHTGSEAFDYGSFLFEQMAKDMKNGDLARQLQSLSLQAQTMGNAIRQASNVRYDGPPAPDMAHLQVRSNILYYLRGLNSDTLITVQYDQHGKLMSEHQSKTGSNSGGEDLRAFLTKSQRILAHPLAKQYPQTMNLLRQERDLLRNLAQHLTLRWESTLYCQRSCENTVATYMRVYTRQTLPIKTLASVTL